MEANISDIIGIWFPVKLKSIVIHKNVWIININKEITDIPIIHLKWVYYFHIQHILNYLRNTFFIKFYMSFCNHIRV